MGSAPAHAPAPGGAELLAVDIALLLPDEVSARAEAINQTLWLRQPDGLRLDDTHLPHLTLAQQFVRRENLQALAGRIDDVLRGRPALRLCVSAVAQSAATICLIVDLTPALEDLHETLMDVVAPLDEPAGGAEAFYLEGEEARPRDVQWVTHFRSRSGYARFAPHITVGHGRPPRSFEPFDFTARRVVLCHLGRYCTCRRILEEWWLGDVTGP